VNLIVLSLTLTLVVQTWYEYHHLACAWLLRIIRKLSVNFSVSGEWSPFRKSGGYQVRFLGSMFYLYDFVCSVLPWLVESIPFMFWRWCNKLKWAPFEFYLLSPHCCGLGAGSILFRAIVNNKQCEMRGLFMSLVIHNWIGEVQDSQGVSTFEMTYIVSGGALSTTHSLRWFTDKKTRSQSDSGLDDSQLVSLWKYSTRMSGRKNLIRYSL